MRTFVAPASGSGDEFLGKFCSAEHYDLLVEDTARVNRPDGSPLLVLLKRAITPAAGRAMYVAVRGKIAVTDNRGLAAGQKKINKIKKDGSRSIQNRTQVGVASGILGYFDRSPRFPYCRKAALNENNPDVAEACLPALQQASELMRQHIPERWEAQRKVAEETSQDFMFAGTIFTTVTLNRNFRTAGHRDAGDLPEGFGAMLCFRGGKYEGGHLVFPAYRVAARLDSLDLILFDPHEVHCNTPIRGHGAYERITAVLYYRKKMRYCGSAAQELELAKQHDSSKPRDMNHPLKPTR